MKSRHIIEPMEQTVETLLTKLSQQLESQHQELVVLRREVGLVRQELADLKTGRNRAKPQTVSNAINKPSLAGREVSKMMFVSWVSRQPAESENETAEERQRRLLPKFESSNNYRVLGVDHLRG